ncbi:diguanylate cyclase [Luteimonas sp. MC1572]|uniref:diguanylate cyclase n=1 Tax=Luteimonas sp. MC1572 TaxID=2799325 RepID=UPI0018F07369|nr:diguanylate cyclase [Luteimonas sp. MC1572]MBJ6981116.1 diguanylate cyclase [Luteimonas sp. MC1572]QQO02450.1 diguanylate cyclase [Luteimonas sp. MC1572]
MLRTQLTLPRRVYPYRVLGMALGALAIATVLLELQAGTLLWALCVFTGVVWPQLAHLLAQRSASPFAAEQRNLIADSALAALWVPLLHFNLLPAVLLLALPAADKVNTDIPGLYRRTLLPTCVAILAGGLATGFAFAPSSSTAVVLACMPMLLIHTLAVSHGRRRLVAKVLRKNQELDLLSRTDMLTGLRSRDHWEREVARTLHEVHAGASPAVLVMIDIDGFKQANDRYGHIAGDALLRAVAALLQETLRPGDIGGRYGGDEFAVVCPATGLTEAAATAEAFRAAVETIRLPQAPDLSHSVSIGIASARPNHARIEDWVNAADAALYEAKRSGRNRMVLART